MNLLEIPAARHPIPDGSGLIWAFRLGEARECGAEVLTGREEDEGPLWLHFNLSNVRSRAWFEQDASLDEDVVEHFADGEARAQVLAASPGLLVMLYDLHHEFKPDCEGFGVLRLYFDGRRLITGRAHPLKAIDALKREVAAGLPADAPSTLVARYLELLADSFGTVVSKAADQVDDAEDDILAGQVHDPGRVLGKLRRLLARLRRHLAANRTALSSLGASLPSWLDAEQRASVLSAVARLDGVAQDLDLVQERARLFQEEIATRMVEATNRNLYVLSLVTTVLLPVTLITGVFGMNVGGVPWAQSSHGFFWVTLLMIIAAGGALWLLHRTRIL